MAAWNALASFAAAPYAIVFALGAVVFFVARRRRDRMLKSGLLETPIDLALVAEFHDDRTPDASS